jgi:hypothetical protein
MNIKTIPLVRPASLLVPILSMLIFSIPSGAETMSGFWINIDPSASSARVAGDFSELTPFCSANETTFYCPFNGENVDFTIYFSSIRAPGGIQYDSALGAAIQAEYLTGKQITRDREGLFYLDSMMKKRGQAAPTTGYLDSCPKNRIVYFLTTKEGNFATMIKVGEYIGGINRTYYYWVYRPDNDGILHKTALFEQRESLNITVDVFSGRSNPTFTLKDSAAIAEIVHQIYVSVNTLLDPSVKRSGDLQCSQGLGYRKLSVIGMFGPDNPISSYMPTLEVCNGGITYNKVPPISTLPESEQLYDPNRRLEKLIIRVCCRLGLSVTDSYGEVRFCDLIPDSLKDLNGERTDRSMARGGKALEFRRLSGDRIVYLVKQAGLVRVNLFDTRGRKIAPVIGRYHLPGEHTLELGKNNVGAGVYFLDLRFGSTPDHVTVPIVHSKGER